MKPINGKVKSQSRLLAEKYGVSPKTVRDIWNKKTWCFATLKHSSSNNGDVILVNKRNHLKN